MKRLLHFMNWPVKANTTALFFTVSLLPHGVATALAIRSETGHQIKILPKENAIARLTTTPTSHDRRYVQ